MQTTDRYRTSDIDFKGQACRMIARIKLHTQGWRNATQGMRCDNQLLLSSP